MDYPIVAVCVGIMSVPVWLVLLTVYEKYRGLDQPRVVMCPSTAGPAAVELTMNASGEPSILGCSRWPQCRPCNQACVHN